MTAGDDGEGVDEHLDAVLAAHHPGVGDGRDRRRVAGGLGIARTETDGDDPVRSDAVVDGAPAAGVVAGDHEIGGSVRSPLQRTQETVQHHVAPELGGGELGRRVVLVVDEPGSGPSQPPAEREQRVGWVGDVEHVDRPFPAETAHSHHGADEASHDLGELAQDRRDR